MIISVKYKLCKQPWAYDFNSLGLSVFLGKMEIIKIAPEKSLRQRLGQGLGKSQVLRVCKGY